MTEVNIPASHEALEPLKSETGQDVQAEAKIAEEKSKDV